MYLVTGATGFLGSTVCRKLISKNEKVRAFVLKNDPALKFVPQGCEIVEGDLCDRESLEQFFTVPEGTETFCLHIASVVTVDPDYNPTVMNVNIGGTQNIIDLCLAHPECRKLVYCGSTGAIPELPKGKKIREVSYFDHTRVRGCYSESKALASQMVLDAVHNRGLNACIVMPSGIMGPEDYAIGETTRVLIQIINGEMPAGINGSFNLCDVRDLADGLLSAVRHGRTGETYILGNEEVTFKEFASLISEEAGTKPMKMFLPLGIADSMAKFLEAQAKMNGKRPLMTTFSVYNLARNNDFDSSKAKAELGYTTRSYKETISDEIAWLRAEGKIKTAAQPVIEAVPAAI